MTGQNPPPMTATTLMFTEAEEAAAAVERQIAANAPLVQDAAGRLRAIDPPFLATVGRGSSDHAATYAKYMFETRLRTLTLSYSPSISTLYDATSHRLTGIPMLVLSQSGRSPDLLATAAAAQKAGALVIAMVNDTASPLASMADILLPLHAGPEKSVAATKSFIAALAAIAHLTAEWSGDAELRRAVFNMGDMLRSAWAMDWSPAVPVFRATRNALVLGRGLTLSIAQEAALKFKETSSLHAEAFSSVEVAHGPMALIEENFPLLVFPPADAAATGLAERIASFTERGAQTMVAGAGFGGRMVLPTVGGVHPALAPLAMIQSFYRLANTVALARGNDPDHPKYLQKVTRTL